MGIFNNYFPYVNFHGLNLDRIIQRVNEARAAAKSSEEAAAESAEAATAAQAQLEPLTTRAEAAANSAASSSHAAVAAASLATRASETATEAGEAATEAQAAAESAAEQAAVDAAIVASQKLIVYTLTGTQGTGSETLGFTGTLDAPNWTALQTAINTGRLRINVIIDRNIVYQGENQRHIFLTIPVYNKFDQGYPSDGAIITGGHTIYFETYKEEIFYLIRNETWQEGIEIFVKRSNYN